MTDFSKATPRPWDHVNGQLYDANDDWVASVGADAASLIVEAVNSLDTNREALAAKDALIKELVELLARYRNETPLGHQPHMIAHVVDEALAKAKEAGHD